MKLGLCADVIKPPCKADCPNRTITCKFDGTCDKYEKFDAEIKELREKRFKERERNRILGDHFERARKNFDPKSKVGEV